MPKAQQRCNPQDRRGYRLRCSRDQACCVRLMRSIRDWLPLASGEMPLLLPSATALPLAGMLITSNAYWESQVPPSRALACQRAPVQRCCCCWVWSRWRTRRRRTQRLSLQSTYRAFWCGMLWRTIPLRIPRNGTLVVARSPQPVGPSGPA